MATGLPAPLLVDVARSAVADAVAAEDPASALARAHQGAIVERRRLLQPVINATGVILHTNLGRAPLGADQPAGYVNLELDLASGKRGDRSAHVARLLAKASGAESALVVNNGAAAIFLVLATLAAGREVIVSRGELVEIGGGFRVPEVLEASGARLIEVGTTNRTRASDYQRAAGTDTAVLLKVHTSNYRISGFVETTSVGELVAVAGRLGGAGASPAPVDPSRPPSPPVEVAVDLGSGLLDANCPWLESGPPSWLGDEPAVRQTLAAGAAIVTFSGDKLLGGPQAGVIAGRAELVERCRAHPLARVLRPGGLTLDSLQQVVLAYLRRDAGRTVPLWQLATRSAEALRTRAEGFGCGEVVACESVMGGGALPGRTIPSVGVAVNGDVTGRLRAFDPPVLARVVGGRTVCDLRTVLPPQDRLLAEALAG
jgi:L-seryl-tRNA(Ser) seleniumtransferase